MQELDLKAQLKKNLDGAERVAVLGVGSELRADDVAGMLVAHNLQTACKSDGGCPHLEIFFGATAPENLTGEIKKFKPSHLVIIDAADTGAEPGTIVLIDPETVGGVSFSTHMMPLKLLVDYITQSFPCTITILGIQPRVLEFGKCVSKEVAESVKQVAEVLTAVIRPA